MKTQWTLQALSQARLKDLTLCQTQQERQLCDALNIKEIKETAIRIKLTRKLSPGELAILQDLI
jgi:hypothetical protein